MIALALAAALMGVGFMSLATWVIYLVRAPSEGTPSERATYLVGPAYALIVALQAMMNLRDLSLPTWAMGAALTLFPAGAVWLFLRRRYRRQDGAAIDSDVFR